MNLYDNKKNERFTMLEYSVATETIYEKFNFDVDRRAEKRWRKEEKKHSADFTKSEKTPAIHTEERCKKSGTFML